MIKFDCFKKLTMKKLPLILMLLLSVGTINSYAQEPYSTEHENQELRDKWSKAKGTFQVQVIGVRLKPQIHISIVYEIERARKKETDTYIEYSENIRIYIPSRSKINQKDFEPLEYITYVNLNE